eukprot:scaffold13592_cov17-Prasinocladus_malaysianus.AAC.1
MFVNFGSFICSAGIGPSPAKQYNTELESWRAGESRGSAAMRSVSCRYGMTWPHSHTSAANRSQRRTVHSASDL